MFRICLAALFMACADPNRAPQTTGDLSWEPCPLRADERGQPTQCTTTAMPLWWDDPEGDTVELFAQRHLSAGGERVLWLLPGGPGQTGAVYEDIIKRLASRLPETDLYVFEHRGVGRSSRLGCPLQEAPDSEDGIDVSPNEWPNCLESVVTEVGDDLAAYSSQAAADDLAEWIRLTAEGREVYVYGASYGTTLAHRFLQRHPDLADGVILDSLALDVDHRVYDSEFDEVARRVFDACSDDDRCTEAMGPDATAEAEAIRDRVDQGSCSAIDGTTLRRGAAAFAADPSMRGFMPALYHRSGRCTEDDADDLTRLRNLFEGAEPHYTETLYSPVLFANIELSEQWPEPWPSLADLEAAEAETLASFGLGARQRPLLDIWPRYPFDYSADNALADTTTPMLLLHGDLDPLTPPWRAESARDHFTAPGQHFVRFPRGSHVLLGTTPAPGGDCATELLADFLDEPMTRPDASCAEETTELDFDGAPLRSWLLFSDCSRYGNGCGGGQASMSLVPLALALFRRRRGSARSASRRMPS
ncbi:MAG: alpha/beta fold hydrolase [Myxococcota bacterium]